jgi:hypothetical protein
MTDSLCNPGVTGRQQKRGDEITVSRAALRAAVIEAVIFQFHWTEIGGLVELEAPTVAACVLQRLGAYSQE